MCRCAINALGYDGAKLLALSANKWPAMCTIAGHSSRKATATATNNCALNRRQKSDKKEEEEGQRESREIVE